VDIELITRRSKVQILPPPPVKSNTYADWQFINAEIVRLSAVSPYSRAGSVVWREYVYMA